MKIKVVNSYTKQIEKININILKYILAFLFPIKIDERKYEGWKGNNAFYLFKCKKCNEWHIDYPHGYNKILFCYEVMNEE